MTLASLQTIYCVVAASRRCYALAFSALIRLLARLLVCSFNSITHYFSCRKSCREIAMSFDVHYIYEYRSERACVCVCLCLQRYHAPFFWTDISPFFIMHSNLFKENWIIRRMVVHNTLRTHSLTLFADLLVHPQFSPNSVHTNGSMLACFASKRVECRNVRV